MNLRKDISLALGVLFVIAVALLVYWFAAVRSQNQYDASRTPYKVLTQEDQSFSHAMTLMKAGQYDEAKQALQASLANASDPQAEAQIRFKIALATEESGDFANAIAQYKSIASNERYFKQIRAYAVQQLASFYYTYNYSHPEVSDEIFKDSPYAEMAQGVDTEMALRRLNEYASSLYLLAPSLMRQADWYATDLSKTLHNASTSPAGIADIAKIKELQSQAQPELDRMRKDANETGPLIDALTREGIVERKLATAGVAKIEDVIAPFRDALSLSATAATVPGQDSYPRYLYAAALATFYGESRADEIISTVSTLKPVTGVKNTYVQSVEGFFRSVRRNNQAQYNHMALIKIADIAPSFKAYLISLGWQPSDFAQ